MDYLKILRKTVIIPLMLASNMISSVHADESEIYFAATDGTGLKPIVFFILDVSGSMTATVSPGTNRLENLKDAMYKVLNSENLEKTNVGFMTFDSSLQMKSPVINASTIDTDLDMLVKKTEGDKVTFVQIINTGYDNGYFTTQAESTIYGKPTVNIGYGIADSASTAFRFSNILLNNYAESGLDSPADMGIESATLMLPINSNTLANNIPASLTLYLDNDDHAPNLDTIRVNGKSFATAAQAATERISCNTTILNKWMSCDIAPLLRAKVSSLGWKSGNAITLYTLRQTQDDAYLFAFKGSQMSSPEYLSSVRGPYIKLTVNKAMAAANKRTQLSKLEQKVSTLITGGITYSVPALLYAAQYISNKPVASVGPYHSNTYPSPLERSCQTTYFVMMSDGDANGGAGQSVKNYLGTSNCIVPSMPDRTTTENSDEACGRYLVDWMANTSQSTFVDNYIVTHTIGFGTGISANGKKFLQDLATLGKGEYYTTENAEGLQDAFDDIIFRAINAGAPAMSGKVVSSTASQYSQRREAYYSIFTSIEKDYWPGNMKGFLLTYVDYLSDDGYMSRRPVLKDKDGTTPVLNTEGAFIEGTSSFWSDNDASITAIGGVVGQLPDDPVSRKIYTKVGDTVIELKPENSSQFTDAQMGTKSETERKALLRFIRGYTYDVTTNTPNVAVKKIADGSRAVAALSTYGCATADTSILDCTRTSLKQYILLPGNDGVLRAFDTRTGKTVYEFMPIELIGNINKMRQQMGVSRTAIRTYGLDGTVKIHHVDTNKNDYIDSGEKAYAFVTAGRGGEFAYILDVSSEPDASKLPEVVKIISNKDSDFSKLGYAWSVPASGKIKVGTDIKDVFIFGAGYDPKQDDNTVRATDTKGNALYITDVKGKLIWSSSSAGVNMQYSIPGTPGILVDKTTGLITDIVVGDMGGQLWRFGVANGQTASSDLIVKAGNNGLVASVADNSATNSRRFYITPALSLVTDPNTGLTKLSVSIGSGYFGHPLNIETKDKLYVFFLPKTATAGTEVIKETMLSEANSPLNTNGFYIPLGLDDKGLGEKVITDLITDFGRVVFNTYVPNTNTAALTDTCRPFSGKQRSYVYDILTGKNMLESAFSETLIEGLPSDVALYCSGRACTFITEAGQLSAEDVLPKGAGGSASPLNVPLCGPKADKLCTHKLGWSDLFDPDPK